MSPLDTWYLMRVQCRNHSYAYVEIKVTDILDGATLDQVMDEAKRIAGYSPVLRQHECGDDQLAIFNVTPMKMGLD